MQFDEYMCKMCGNKPPQWICRKFWHHSAPIGVTNNHVFWLICHSPKCVFPKIVGFPPKSSILIAFYITNPPFWGVSLFLKAPKSVGKSPHIFFRREVHQAQVKREHPAETLVQAALHQQVGGEAPMPNGR